jgi:acetolactate synthase I/II/III large subunit
MAVLRQFASLSVRSVLLHIQNEELLSILSWDACAGRAHPRELKRRKKLSRKKPHARDRAAGELVAGLGASGGMALGAKLAAPERMMVQVVGDGSFYFNVPTSVFAASRQYDLPFLSIVLDNSGWGAVKEATLKVYPDGNAKDTGAYEAELCPDVEFSKIAEAFGIHAEKFTDPAAVTDALGRCVDVVRGGRGALLHVRVTPI